MARIERDGMGSWEVGRDRDGRASRKEGRGSEEMGMWEVGRGSDGRKS